MSSLPRLGSAVALALVLSSCAQVPTGGTTSPSATPSASETPAPTPTSSAVTLEVSSGATPLVMRNMPQPAGTSLARLTNGTPIIVDCVVSGAASNGTQGASDLWDHLVFEGHSGFVSAAYVKGGTDAKLPRCAVTPAESKTPKALPTPLPATSAEKAVAIATGQLGVAETAAAPNCSPYATACGDWSPHFAVWVWAQSGITLPATTKVQVPADIFIWGKGAKRAHDTLDGIAPGDLVFFGTGPTWKPAGRVDVVIGVFPDHLHTIGGNLDDRVSERDVPRSGIYGYLSTKPS